MPENSTTALVKTTQSPALARVSSQLALTDKLLANKPIDIDDMNFFCEKPVMPNLPTVEEYAKLSQDKKNEKMSILKEYNSKMQNYLDFQKMHSYAISISNLRKLQKLIVKISETYEETYAYKLREQLLEQIRRMEFNLPRLRKKLISNPRIKELMIKKGL